MRVRLLGHHIPLSMAVLAILESVAVFGGLIAARFLRFHWSPDAVDYDLGPLWARGLLFTSATLACTMAFGLYSERQRARTVGILIRVVASVGAGIAIAALGFYLIPHLWIGRAVLLIAGLLVIALMLLLRLGFSRLVDPTTFKRRVLVYGTGQRAKPIAGLRRSSDQRGFVLVGFVQPPGEELALPPERQVYAGEVLLELCGRHEVDEIVVAMDDRREAFPVRELLDCRLAGIDVTDLSTFLERETGRVRLDVLNPSWLIFGEGFKRGSFRLQSARVLDLLAASALFILTCPLMVATVLAIKLEDGWRAPVFYQQERVGFGGRVFRLLKFRSMRVDAEAAGQAALGAEARHARHSHWCRDPQAADRRATSDPECTEGRDGFGGTASGATSVCTAALRENPVLRRAPQRETRDHGLGTALLSLWILRAGRAGEIAV